MPSIALHDLLVLERSSILARCEEKVLSFGGALAAHPPAEGWAIYYDDLIAMLDTSLVFTISSVNPLPLRSSFTREFVTHGYTISEVVHSYGIISQAIADLAQQAHYVLSPSEHAQLNLSLGTVIADAVTAFEEEHGRERDLRESQRIGTLAHELRNNLQSATIALELIGAGITGANSNTSGSLQNSLQRMGQLIDTTLTEVRLRVEPNVHLTDVRLIDVMSEIATTAGFVARSKGISLVVQGQYDLVIFADRQLIVSALSNLVQNAIKFSAEKTSVRIAAVKKGDKILIDVVDHCGGLPAGTAEEMFKPFVQHSSDRSGIGLGLTISYNAIKRCHGELHVKDVPGTGCIFTIELPAGSSDSLGLLAPPHNWP